MRNVRKVMRGKQAFKEEIDRRLSAEDSEKVWKQAHKRLAKMYRDYSNLPKGVSNHTDSFIFPAAAIYLSIRKVAPEEAFDIMKVVMKARTEKMGQTIAKMTGIPGFKSFVLKMWGVMSHKMFGPTAGFQNVFYPKTKGEFRMDITACPYHKYLTELGCPEINILFCDNDVYTYGNLPGLKFIRTKTIGAGNELCDFKMVIEKMR